MRFGERNRYAAWETGLLIPSGTFSGVPALVREVAERGPAQSGRLIVLLFQRDLQDLRIKGLAKIKSSALDLVRGLAPGDRVFGGARGSFAEYAVASPAALAPIPAGLSFGEAGAMGVAGVTALEARDGAWWDAGKIGLGPPPLETPDGLLLCYHGVHATASGPIYRVGLALLDLDDPRRVMRRTDEWVLAPTEPYERSGDVNKVIFPTGWLIDPTTQRLSIYYGAGDSVIALVSTSLSDVLSLLRTDPSA